MADKKKCAMCGKLYDACDRCEEIAQRYTGQYGYAPWRTVACSVECYQLYDVVRRYGFGQIPKEEAREMISNIVDLPDLSLVPESAAVVSEILASHEDGERQSDASPAEGRPAHKTARKVNR